MSARLMGFDPLSIDYIRLAHERGLGIGDVREIEIVGDVDAAEENWRFEVGHSFHLFLAWLSWYGPTKVLQRFIFHTPVVHLPILVSEFDHDYAWWPLKGKRIFEAWLAGTPWGALFQRYLHHGVLGAR